MGVIRLFVRNPVAANMIMLLILVGGVVAAYMIPRELIPEFSTDMITVTVPYPGSPAEDIEKGICLKIEDYVSNIDGIKDVTSISREGLGMVLLELQTGSDMRKVLDEVRDEIGKITFPANAEDPIIQESTQKFHVINIAVAEKAGTGAGIVGERALRELAHDIKDDLTDLPEISRVVVSGIREYEVSVEVDEAALRRFKLTLGQVALAIRSSSFDLPAGTVKTSGGEMALRVVGQRYLASEYETIPVLYQSDGTVICLRDIATVRESFQDTDIGGQFNGQTAALVSVYKTGDEDIIEICEAVREYVKDKRSELPDSIHLETWFDLSELVTGRLDMLIRNGVWGLILVMGVLWLFLGLRLSFWVAMGIPLSVLGTILVMLLVGQTLNMLSMFALIMALGLIVDDAIVVGENVYSRRQRGELPGLAATHGAKQVIMPVIGAVATTWLAFIPLFFIPGIMGKFISQMPAVVILTLAFSLLECIIILPSHLAHSLEAQDRQAKSKGTILWFIPVLGAPLGALVDLLLPRQRIDRIRQRTAAMRRRIDAGIQGFIDNKFLPLYRLATRNRYVTVAVFGAILIVMIGAYMGDHIKVTVFPKMEADALQATVVLPAGTPIERTREVARQITEGVFKLNEDGRIKTDSGDPVVERAYSLIGTQTNPNGQQGGHVAEVLVELVVAQNRGRHLRSADLVNMWRENTGPVHDALSLRFVPMRGGPTEKSLQINVLSDPRSDPKGTDARKAVDRIKARLGKYKVSDLEDDALAGKTEIRITPSREAFAAGVNRFDLAAQLRDAFYGNESIEMQRGRDEVKVMVRYPERQRRSVGDIENMRVRTPADGELPFGEAADVEYRPGSATLRRLNSKRVITIIGDVDEQVANSEQILSELEDEGFFDKISQDMPGITVDIAGQRQQQTESLESLFVWFPMALLGIYTILAAIFRSYIQPIIVMVAIPFGLIGAVIGHWLLGFNVSLLSLFGMVALAGIVVNDSLVLLDLVNVRIRAGDTVHAAAETGARGRFRAIILTTVTTAAGMTPLLMERSFQAQFLKPMAISIAAGLVFATMLTLLVVPCLFLIGNDIRRVIRWLVDGQWVSPEAVLARATDAAGVAEDKGDCDADEDEGEEFTIDG